MIQFGFDFDVQSHHPSILMWCGINEAAMWWHEDYNSSFTDRGPWPGLAAAKPVEEICHELDPDRYFIPSAPYGGENANDTKEGSTNGYTNMWFVPGYDYLNFASEVKKVKILRHHEKGIIKVKPWYSEFENPYRLKIHWMN